jgi:hypothetical protein
MLLYFAMASEESRIRSWVGAAAFMGGWGELRVLTHFVREPSIARGQPFGFSPGPLFDGKRLLQQQRELGHSNIALGEAFQTVLCPSTITIHHQRYDWQWELIASQIRQPIERNPLQREWSFFHYFNVKVLTRKSQDVYSKTTA